MSRLTWSPCSPGFMFQMTTSEANTSTSESSPNAISEGAGSEAQTDGDEHLEAVPGDRGPLESPTEPFGDDSLVMVDWSRLLSRPASPRTRDNVDRASLSRRPKVSPTPHGPGPGLIA